MAWLFYDSVWGLFSAIGILPLAIRTKRKNRDRKERREILKEFQSILYSILAAISTGLSVENAFVAAETELLYLFGNKSILLEPIHRIQQEHNFNVPIEKAFAEFAEGVNVEEISLFSEVFSYAKRGGGDFIQIMDTSIRQIREQFETEQEIETMIAAKKMEQILMCIIPVCLLLYMKVSSPDFLSILYHNLYGAVFMTFVLVSYIGSAFLAARIVEIKV